VYIFFRGWGISCAAIVIPLYLDGMTFSKTGIGIILSLSATTMALSLPFTGRLADITRKETLIFIGGAAASLCLMLIPRLSGLFPLMAAVTAGGFFSALSQPSCSSLLVEIADNGSIGLIMGRFNFIMGLGAAVGAVTSSALFASFGVALTLSVAGVMNIAASFIFAAMTERSFSLSSS
jgi:sugar phosphate permease